MQRKHIIKIVILSLVILAASILTYIWLTNYAPMPGDDPNCFIVDAVDT